MAKFLGLQRLLENAFLGCETPFPLCSTLRITTPAQTAQLLPIVWIARDEEKEKMDKRQMFETRKSIRRERVV
jgi:hypothetical protein